ncbi:glycosyltransferase family 2 protein [Candidatus Omnitrophota bacterium]
MNICVAIPSKNEARNIGDLIQKIKRLKLDVVVIDDGSTDATASIAKKHGAIVLRNEQNKGKGVSLRMAFDFVIVHNYTGVIVMDGDGQHDPADIPHFIDKVKSTHAGLIVGNRMIKPDDMPFIRWCTNTFMSMIISSISRQNIPDSQCGYRYISSDVLEKMKFISKKFEIESEILIEASRAGCIIDSVSIRSIYQGQTSKINPIIDTLRFLRFIIRKLWVSRN